jgi:hypothetical protein
LILGKIAGVVSFEVNPAFHLLKFDPFGVFLEVEGKRQELQ